ncbi:MAG: type II secretion system protein [Patescibacteria group bacterium]|nr:type II secretion system protein [bacterium]MDZ4227108.1 type II secretion system protein [Patescibacteria group bacterium]
MQTPLRTTHYALRTTRGFTLVEMIVAVGLFAIVMVVCVSTLLSLVNANRKAQALQSVMNNLNIALDGMVRSARAGSVYHGAGGNASCGGLNYNTPHDCVSGGTIFAFEPYGNSSSDQPWVYSFAQDDNGIGRIYKSENGGIPIPITAPEVIIKDVQFYVVGTTRGDTTQPKAVIVVKGEAGVPGSKAQTTFHIQATSVQRLLDL